MEILTHSKRQAFKTCPRYFYHRHEQRLALRREKAGRRRGSIFGSAIFAAKDGDPNPLQVIAAAYAELHPESTEDAEALAIERAKIEVMVYEYIKRYGFDDRREIVFDTPLRHPLTGGHSKTFRNGGKIDGVVHEGPRQVRIVEDKFVGQIQKAMIDRLPLDAQATQYVEAFLSVGWSASVDYRHTRYPGINPNKERRLKTKTHPAESLTAFQDRLRSDIAERPGFYFDRQLLAFPRDAIDDFRRGRWGTASDIIRARRKAKLDWQEAFPQNSSRCWEWGGCEFIPLCTKQPGAIDLYVVQEDNPELPNAGGVTSEYAAEEA